MTNMTPGRGGGGLSVKWIVGIIAVALFVVWTGVIPFGALIGLAALGLLIYGLCHALAGHFLKMHPETHSRGQHHVRHGLIGALVGFAVLAGGLSIVWGVGALLVGQITGQVRTHVTLPAAPAALNVQAPDLFNQLDARPSPTPIVAGNR